MKTRKTYASVIGISLILSLLFTLPVTANETFTELFNIDFSDEALYGEMFSEASAVTFEFITESGIGKDDDSALRVSKPEPTNYNSYANAVRITFPEPLPAGGTYNFSAWFFVPIEGHEDKDVLTGPGIVLNGDYAGAQGKVKFPENFGTMPVGEWKEINVTFPMETEELLHIDLRFVINEQPKHPDVWYIDNIVINRVGELTEVFIPAWDLTVPSLRETYSAFFPIGNIMDVRDYNNDETLEMYKYHYNFVTLENSMKPDSICRNKDVYTFESADMMIKWALDNNMKVHGHAMVWHKQSAAWFTHDDAGNLLTRAEARDNLEAYINKVGNHFKGRIHSWEVVNEVFTASVGSGDWKSLLRTGGTTEEDSQWYAAYENGADASKGESGADYIYDAFVFTRLADPEAILYYNDFNENERSKAEAIAQMVEELNNLWKNDARNTEPDRLLVEGIGMQAHYWTADLVPANVEWAIQRFIETGCEIGVLELDIPAGSYFELGSRSGELTDEEAQKQAQLYREVFEIFVKYNEHISRVTLWGKADSQSWRAKGSPLLFDEMFSVKPAFHSVIAAAETEFVEETEQPGETADVVEAEDNSSAERGTGGHVIALIIAVVAVIAGVLLFTYFRKKRK